MRKGALLKAIQKGPYKKCSTKLAGYLGIWSGHTTYGEADRTVLVKEAEDIPAITPGTVGGESRRP